MLSTLLIVMVLLLPFQASGQDKVTICHKGQTITVAAPAVAAHERNHGDTHGPCEPEGRIGPVDTTPDPVCYEDEPCWDCDTMGNRTCGPVVVDPPPLVQELPLQFESLTITTTGSCLRWHLRLPYCD